MGEYEVDMQERSIEELRQEYADLKKLIDEFALNKSTLSAVIRRESADKRVPNKGIAGNSAEVFGMNEIAAYDGYSLIINAYMALREFPTTDKEKNETELERLRLAKALKILADLKTIFKYYKVAETSKDPRLKEEILKGYKEYFLSELEKNNEIYTIGGYSKHHAIIKYAKDGDIYTRTEFNEGAGLDSVENSQYAWGVSHRRIKEGDLAKVISIDVENIYNDSHARDKILPLLEPRSKEDREASIITTKQVIGNCTTRSTRALLRSLIGPVNALSQTELVEIGKKLNIEPFIGQVEDLSKTELVAEIGTKINTSQSTFRHLYELATMELPEIEKLLKTKLQQIQETLQKKGVVIEDRAEQIQPLRGVSTRKKVEKIKDFENEKLTELVDLVIKQAEHIMRGNFAKNEDFETFKNRLRKSLATLNSDFLYNAWSEKVLYLSPDSLEDVAFYLAKGLITEKVLSAEQKGSQVIVKISPKRGKVEIQDALLAAGYVIKNAHAGGEEELGRDYAVTYEALKLLERLAIDFPNDNGIAKAKFVATIKIMLREIAEPYRIDEKVMEKIREKLEQNIKEKIKEPITLSGILKSYKALIDSTKEDLQLKTDLSKLLKPSSVEKAEKPISKAKTANLLSLHKVLSTHKIKDFFKDGAPVSPEDFNKAMKAALELNDLEIAVRLVKAGADINTKDAAKETLLMKACIDGKTEVVDFLVKNKAKLNATDNLNRSALYWAVRQNGIDAAKILIKAGVDSNARSYEILEVNGKTLNYESPLTFALKFAQQDLALEMIRFCHDPVKLETANGEGTSALIIAAAKGFTAIVDALVAKGVEVDAKDRNGNTALHLAMQNGKYEVASVIVKAGADIEIKNEHGKTALGMALDSNNVPMIKELLLNGANPKNVDSKKTSHEARLIFAEYNADPLKWLVDNKASPEVIAKFSPAKEESLAPEKDKDSGHAARVKINQAESYSERMVGEKNKTEVIGK